MSVPHPHDYRLYGLTLRSNEPLPYLRPADTDAVSADDIPLTFYPERIPSLNVGVDDQRLLRQAAHDVGLEAWRTANGILLLYTNGSESARALIDSSGALHIWHHPILPLDDLLPILYGTALSVALNIRGLTCLHASAVAVADQAILIVGVSGVGKSTLAAALVDRGLQFVSDDAAVLLDAAEFAVQPGADALRLWAAHPTRKFWQPMAAPDEAVPIRLIYLLAMTDAQAEIAPLAKRDAFLALAQHPYARALQPDEAQTRTLDRLRRLVEAVPVRVLRRSPDPKDLAATVTLIEGDLRAMLQAQP